MRVTIFGSGGGALAAAADFSSQGHAVILSDLPEFLVNLAAVRERGGVQGVSDWRGTTLYPVEVASSAAEAVPPADLIVVVVPCFGHEAFVDLMLPVLRAGQSLVFVGEGSGSLVAYRALRESGRRDVRIGETNTLPYLSRPAGPGAFQATRKRGGVFLSSIPSNEAADLVGMVHDVWPYVSPAESVWETVLLNYNAIDHVPPMICNAGTIENRRGLMLLWGEGASRSVVNVIEAVDLEILKIRHALGLHNTLRYRDLLVEQGCAPDVSPQLYDVVQASSFAKATIASGEQALKTRYITEDIPYGLVLITSVADELGVDTPVMDSLVTMASTLTGRNFWNEGRHLSDFGLRGAGLSGLTAFAESGELPR